MTEQKKYSFLWRENYVDYLWATNVTAPAYFQKTGVLIYEQHQLSAYAPDDELKCAAKTGKDLFNANSYRDIFKKLQSVVAENKTATRHYSSSCLRKLNNDDLLRRYERLFKAMRNFINLYRYTEPYYLTAVEEELDTLLIAKESDYERREHLKVQLLSSLHVKQNSRTSQLVNFLQEVSKERFEAKRMDAAISDCAENLLEETARRFFIAVTQVSNLTKPELNLMLLENKEPDINTLNTRKQAFALEIASINSFKEYIGEDFNKFKSSVTPQKQLEDKIIRGSTAFPGKITGQATILPPISTTEEYREFINKFKDGSILVAPMTSPELVPVFKKVIAIITDEGGITSHAALIAREMKIPCIVGTSYATKLIKDDMELLVDATKGQVKII